jgi:methionyl-tRNA synthetase
LVNGLCPDHQTKPDVITEKNWFFKLSNYQDKLLELFGKNPTFVEPASRFNEVKSFVNS